MKKLVKKMRKNKKNVTLYATNENCNCCVW